MQRNVPNEVNIYATGAILSVLLAELAKLKSDPGKFLTETEGALINGVYGSKFGSEDDPLADIIQHGVLEGIGSAFSQARAWIEIRQG